MAAWWTHEEIGMLRAVIQSAITQDPNLHAQMAALRAVLGGERRPGDYEQMKLPELPPVVILESPVTPREQRQENRRKAARSRPGNQWDGPQ